MSKYKNIEKLIEYTANALIVEAEQYGNNLLMGIEFVINCKAPIRELINRATSPSDMDAMDALDHLCDFSEKYPAFMFVHATCLEEGLMKLEEKATLWLNLNDSEKNEMIHELVRSVYLDEE